MQLNLGNGLVMSEDNRVINLTRAKYSNDDVVHILKTLMKNDLSDFKVITDELSVKQYAFMSPYYGLEAMTTDEIDKLIENSDNVIILNIQNYSIGLMNKVANSNKSIYIISVEIPKD